METGESVYSLIPQPKPEVQRSERYTSRFHQQAATVPPSYSTLGLHGSARVCANASGAETLQPQKALTARPNEKVKRKAPLVQRTEKPVMGLVTEKNFIKENAAEIIHSAPAKRRDVEPLASKSNAFGKVPNYLTRVKAQVETEQQLISSMNNNATAQVNRMQQFPESDRAELLAGLRRKWEECHKQYQKLTFNIDTGAKVSRKEGLEVQMEMIEKAVEKLSKKNVFIYDDMA